mmetsp:Transcript_43473/g.103352  ORF Transcript_43473/g.103352 Transcript_43473/m.103352 type:complete len:234 (+) Transcript_43473:2768-3469(+)
MSIAFFTNFTPFVSFNCRANLKSEPLKKRIVSFKKDRKSLKLGLSNDKNSESKPSSNINLLIQSNEDERDKMFDTILQELSAIQQNAPRKVAILGTRHFSYLHQQVVELLTYANLLVGNHVFTSGGAGNGTNAAVIRGALRAEKPDFLTVVLPQSLKKQPPDVREILEKVQNIVEMTENDDLSLDVASRLCNSEIIDRCDHLITFAFHDSDVVLDASKEAKALNKLVTLLYLD